MLIRKNISIVIPWTTCVVNSFRIQAVFKHFINMYYICIRRKYILAHMLVSSYYLFRLRYIEIDIESIQSYNRSSNFCDS